MNDIKRVGIYARVSTTNQTSENQLLDLRKYCEARKWEIAGEFVDEAMSGSRDDRPQYKEIMIQARQHKFDAILTWKYDRIARSLLNLVSTLEELRVMGLGFISYTEGIDTSTPSGKMVFGVIASLAEFERSLIIERVRAGLRRAKAQGKRLGRAPFVIDMSKLYQLRHEGMTVREIGIEMSISKSLVAKRLSTRPYQNHSAVSVEAKQYKACPQFKSLKDRIQEGG